jgi:hypothetical protein
MIPPPLPRPAAAAARRPLIVPPEPHTAPIGEQALRAAYEAHKSHEHAGQPGRGCSTCRRYLTAVVHARAAERLEP